MAHIPEKQYNHRATWRRRYRLGVSEIETGIIPIDYQIITHSHLLEFYLQIAEVKRIFAFQTVGKAREVAIGYFIAILECTRKILRNVKNK